MLVSSQVSPYLQRGTGESGLSFPEFLINSMRGVSKSSHKGGARCKVALVVVVVVVVAVVVVVLVVVS